MARPKGSKNHEATGFDFAKVTAERVEKPSLSRRPLQPNPLQQMVEEAHEHMPGEWLALSVPNKAAADEALRYLRRASERIGQGVTTRVDEIDGGAFKITFLVREKRTRKTEETAGEAA